MPVDISGLTKRKPDHFLQANIINFCLQPRRQPKLVRVKQKGRQEVKEIAIVYCYVNAEKLVHCGPAAPHTRIIFNIVNNYRASVKQLRENNKRQCFLSVAANCLTA